MKNIYTVLFLAVLICLFSKAADAQDFPYEKYKTRTLAEIIEFNSDVKNADVLIGKDLKAPQIVINADFLYSQVRVKFMNKSRPISAERKELLKIWQKTFSIEDRIANLFVDEYLFKECNNEYWIPVQKQVAAYFPKELKEGDMISLFLMRGGGQKAKEATVWDWLFLVNEFVK